MLVQGRFLAESQDVLAGPEGVTYHPVRVDQVVRLDEAKAQDLVPSPSALALDLALDRAVATEVLVLVDQQEEYEHVPSSDSGTAVSAAAAHSVPVEAEVDPRIVDY